MHTFTGNSCNMHHHGDYSGNAFIYSNIDEKTIEISIEDMEEFLGEKYKSELMARIEEMETSEFLEKIIIAGHKVL